MQRDGGDLGEGVDAGVGAAAALRERLLAGDARDRVGKRALDGGAAGLHLPAGEGRAVVRDGELPVLRGGGSVHGRGCGGGELAKAEPGRKAGRCSLFATASAKA